MLIDPFGTLDSSTGPPTPSSGSGGEPGGYVSLSDTSDVEDAVHEHRSRDESDSMPVLWEVRYRVA